MKKLLLLILSLGLLGALSESTAQADCQSCGVASYSSYSSEPTCCTTNSYYPAYYSNSGCCRGSLHWGGYWY